MNDNSQSQVYEAIRKRGYRDDWTAEQYLGRQVAKMTEELKELSDTLEICHWGSIHLWKSRLRTSGREAAAAFNQLELDLWEVEITDIEQAKKETADLQVVLFQIAAAIEEIDGQPFDVVQAAVDKAKNDIERGVR